MTRVLTSTLYDSMVVERWGAVAKAHALHGNRQPFTTVIFFCHRQSRQLSTLL